MEYIDGFLLPDDFIKKYTKFSSFSEFKKIAKKHGIKILKSKYEEEFTDKSTLTPKMFFENYTSFKNAEELYEIAEKECIKKPQAPKVLPKIYIKNGFVNPGYISPENIEYKCLNCGEKLVVLKDEIISSCKCSNPLLRILKIF